MSLHCLESHFCLHKAQLCSTESTMCDHHVFIFALVFCFVFLFIKTESYYVILFINGQKSFGK